MSDNEATEEMVARVIEDVRHDLAHARRVLVTTSRKNPGWKDRIDLVSDLLFCGIVTAGVVNLPITTCRRTDGSVPIEMPPDGQRVSVTLGEVRDMLSEARSKIRKVHGKHPGSAAVINHVAGLLTCGIVTLCSSKKELAEYEIKTDDIERGEHLMFDPRGIGMDSCPGCFVCGPHEGMAKALMSNIAAFVRSKCDGEKIVTWFDDRARLDFRPGEPTWIQVKVGACKAHHPNLQHLFETTSQYSVIREKDIAEAREFKEHS